MGHGNRIQRDYSKPFFSKRKNRSRLYFVVFMLLAIVSIPALLYWQQDTLRMEFLEAAGIAPTSTPFASERAERGEAFYRAGDIPAAAANFEIAVTQQPETVDYLYEYGVLQLEQNNNDQAVTLGDRIIELAPNDPRGYALKANALAWANPAEAIPVALTGVEESDRQFAPLHGALAVAYTSIGRYQEALQQGDLAVRIDPMDAGARRSFSYPLIYTGDYSAAINQLEQAISINPNLTGPYFELASLYRLINRDEYGTAIYERVMELDPDNWRAYLRMCQTYSAAGLFQEAETYCNEAERINTKDPEVHRTLGQLQYSRRNYEGAINSFRTCLNLEMGEPYEQLPQSFDVALDIDDLPTDETEIECLYIMGLAHYALAHCDAAWTYLTEAQQHPRAQGTTSEDIQSGLFLVSADCAGYENRSLPTAIPPTPIPPTPIGGL
jgi:tetratricopeptide (TPR) repeat protein